MFSPLSTQFSRHIILGDNETEEQFVGRVSEVLKSEMDITLRKALCGLGDTFDLGGEKVKTGDTFVPRNIDAPIDRLTRRQAGRRLGLGLARARVLPGTESPPFEPVQEESTGCNGRHDTSPPICDGSG